MKHLVKNVCILLVLALVLATSAFAHSKAEGTTPADGATVKGSPAVIAIRFDMPLRVTNITLKDAKDQNFALQRADDVKKPITVFEAKPETLKPGSYHVEWRGLAEDGHAMSGHFMFTVE